MTREVSCFAAVLNCLLSDVQFPSPLSGTPTESHTRIIFTGGVIVPSLASTLYLPSLFTRAGFKTKQSEI